MARGSRFILHVFHSALTVSLALLLLTCRGLHGPPRSSSSLCEAQQQLLQAFARSESAQIRATLHLQAADTPTELVRLELKLLQLLSRQRGLLSRSGLLRTQAPQPPPIAAP
eukprot:RCo036385